MKVINSISSAAATCWRANALRSMAHSQATNWQVVAGLKAVNQMRLAQNDRDEQPDGANVHILPAIHKSCLRKTD